MEGFGRPRRGLTSHEAVRRLVLTVLAYIAMALAIAVMVAFMLAILVMADRQLFGELQGSRVGQKAGTSPTQTSDSSYGISEWVASQPCGESEQGPSGTE
jgi:ABC-type transport system involved in cytochrome bd biosynthesis fused ATPase/permease subunit